MNLIPQTWRYGGVDGGESIPFEVGRPELVGTLPEYRNRGLIRAQFEVVHQWCAERGLILQAITGIPYYYRLFGYEMGLELGGGRAGYFPHIPKLKAPPAKDGSADAPPPSEPYLIRPALETDLPFLSDLYDQGCRRSRVSAVYPIEFWRYELNGKSAQNVNRVELRVIETPGGERVGFLAHPAAAWGAMMVVNLYELKPGVSWAAVTPAVIRYLQAVHPTYLSAPGSDSQNRESFASFGFWLGSDHPVYHVIPERLPRVRQPYAFYVRIPDLPGFLRLITPVLEKRLADSPLTGYTGETKITFYRSGVRLVFEDGKLTTAEAYQPTPVGHSGDAAFPELTFLQLLFGYRSLADLRYAFADCWTNDDVDILLDTLFPKQSSLVWALS